MTPEGGRTPDGRYLYTEQDCRRTALTLYDVLHENVFEHV
jgi:hypothetical protein